MKCLLCDGCGWVCENHPDKPWEGEHACPCGGAGMPCRHCNMRGGDEDPRPPEGFRTDADKKGRRRKPGKGWASPRATTESSAPRAPAPSWRSCRQVKREASPA